VPLPPPDPLGPDALEPGVRAQRSTLVGSVALALAFALALGLLVGLEGPASAQEAAPPHLPPVHEVHVDGVGALGKSTTTIRVEKGDTLGGLAQRHLGTVRLTKEILRHNPGLTATSLRAGQSLVLPPRSATGWTDLYVALPGGIAQPVSVGKPATLPFGPVTVFAVPHARAQALRALDRDRRLVEPLLRADAEVARSPAFEPVGDVAEGVARALTKVRVTAIADGRVELKVLDRQVVTVAATSGGSGGAQRSRGGLIVPLGLVAAGLLVAGAIALTARRLAGGSRPSRDDAA
jgi:LysM repeat protein